MTPEGSNAQEHRNNYSGIPCPRNLEGWASTSWTLRSQRRPTPSNDYKSNYAQLKNKNNNNNNNNNDNNNKKNKLKNKNSKNKTKNKKKKKKKTTLLSATTSLLTLSCFETRRGRLSRSEVDPAAPELQSRSSAVSDSLLLHRTSSLLQKLEMT